MEVNTEDLEKAYQINDFISLGLSKDDATILADLNFIDLTFSNGSIDIRMRVMVDKLGNFRGLDNFDRLIMGSFIDDKYITFAIFDNNIIRKYDGYNNGDFMSIQIANTKIRTGLNINKLNVLNDRKVLHYINTVIKFNETDTLQLFEVEKCINNNKRYIYDKRIIQYELNVEDAPIIKKLTNN